MSKNAIKYHVYGDESVSNNIITYALFACSPSVENEALEILDIIKVNVTGKNDYPLHCRQLFHKHQREKMGLASLDEKNVRDLYFQLFTALNDFKFKKLIVIADKHMFPEKNIPKSGIFPEMPINDKTLITFCANASILPFFDAFKRIDCIRFFADIDKSKIDWLGKKRQAINTFDFYISGKNTKPVDMPRRVSPEIYKEKPKLLEIADAIAYISAKALSVEQFGGKKWFSDLYKLISPYEVHFTRHPSNGHFAVNIESPDRIKLYLDERDCQL